MTSSCQRKCDSELPSAFHTCPYSERTGCCLVQGQMFSGQVTEMDLLKNYFPGWLQGWQVLHCKRISGPVPNHVVGHRLRVCCVFVSYGFSSFFLGPLSLILPLGTCSLAMKSEGRSEVSHLLLELSSYQMLFCEGATGKGRWLLKCPKLLIVLCGHCV